MNSVGKWKIATYILAATTAVSFYRGHGASASASASAASTNEADFHKRLRGLGSLRIPAAMAGVDEGQLLRDLAAAKSTQQITILCERIGIFGTDRSLDALEELSRRRSDMAGPAITAMGSIGSDEATDRLIQLVGNGGSTRSYWAVRALGKTKNRRAEGQLIEWAEGGSRRTRLGAIEALGTIGGPDVMAVLQDLSKDGDQEVQRYVVVAAGAMATKESVALLQELAERGSRQVRLAALNAFPSSISEDQQEWLMSILTTSDLESAAAAAEALGRAHATDALPLLMDVAERGAPAVRMGAVRALAAIGGPEAIASLEALLPSAGQYTAYEIARALLENGGKAGRDAFLAALQTHPMRTQLLSLMADLDGEDVDALRIDIARNGNPQERDVALQQLAGRDSDEVLELMLDVAQNGPINSRLNALRLLSQNGSPAARDAVFQLARGGGQTSQEALRLLGERAATDPEAEDLLIETFRSGSPMQAQAASWALANAGTSKATEALLAAVQSGDHKLAAVALGALPQVSSGPEVTDALARLARDGGDAQLRSGALNQLVAMGSPEATALVADAIRRGEPGASYALPQLVQNGGPEVHDILVEASQSDKPEARASVANALSGRGDSESMALLDTLSRDDDATVKSAAIYALANTGSTESMDRLVELAKSGETSDRTIALSALGNSGDPRATPLLVDSIRSGDPQLVQTAIYSAYNAGPEIDSALVDLAEDGDAEMYLRQQALQALTSRGVEVDSSAVGDLRAQAGAANGEGRYYLGDDIYFDG